MLPVPARIELSRPVSTSKAWLVTMPLPAVCWVMRISASTVLAAQ
jgi:hypothetical protein